MHDDAIFNELAMGITDSKENRQPFPSIYVVYITS